jgi:uncharacterized HAD superfamily protein
VNIGLDIDDTMTNSSDLIIEYAKKYFESDDINLINNILNSKEIEGKLLDFYREYLPEMMRIYDLKDNVKEVIDRLRSKGNKIIIITARGYTIEAGLIEITKEYFEKHQIVVDEMVFQAIEKTEACIKNNIDIMIDDSISVLEKLKETNTNTLLFDSANNKDYKTNIDRVNNWLELEEYLNKLLLSEN